MTIKSLTTWAKNLAISALLIFGVANRSLAQVSTSSNSHHISKTITVCPFNVDGLPKKFGFIDVNPDGKDAEGAKIIGQYINKSDVDIWALSEDFNFHNDLANELSQENFQIGTYRGGINLKNFKFNAKFDVDGLNLICKKPVSFSQESWTKWNQCYGWIDHGNDEMITKGYRYYLVDLGDNINIGVYIFHMDADDGEKDNAARASQLEQLRDAVLSNDSRLPIIVMGDTNCRYTRDNIIGLFINPIEERGYYEVKDAWIELCKQGIYPKLGDDALMVNSLGYLQGEVVDKVIYLNPKQGDVHIKANQFSVDTEMAQSDHKPILVTMNIEREEATGIGSINKPSQQAKPIAIYDLKGVRRSQMVKGINIVRMSNGEIKKISY